MRADFESLTFRVFDMSAESDSDRGTPKVFRQVERYGPYDLGYIAVEHL